MPRVYVKKRVPTYLQEDLEQAITAVENGISIFNASKKYKIPCETLRRWIVKHPTHKGSRKLPVFSYEEERIIVESLKFMARCGYPQDRKDLKYIVKKFAEALPSSRKMKIPFNDFVPGPDWLQNFEKRWYQELRRRKPELLTNARANAMATHSSNTPSTSQIPPLPPFEECTSHNVHCLHNEKNCTISSPYKDLKSAILTALSPKVSNFTAACIKNLKQKRKCVQVSAGEILTDEDVLERLRNESENRNAEKSRKMKKKSNNTENFISEDLSGKEIAEKIAMKQDLTVGAWVKVLYLGKKSKQEFVGKILAVDGDNYEVKYLKKSKMGNFFIFPDIDDVDYIEEEQVIKILNEPHFDNRGHYFVQE